MVLRYTLKFSGEVSGMVRVAAEDYLGAIYRLRMAPDVPVPLAALQERLQFSAMAVHEMVQKLTAQGWIAYHPYRGVTLTEAGEALAQSVIRRHRLWERFLTDWLGVPWDEAHEIAGALEHAAPEKVTERLAQLMGEPEHCPHGGPIPPHIENRPRQILAEAPVGQEVELLAVEPELPEVLRWLEQWHIEPGTRLLVQARSSAEVRVCMGTQELTVPLAFARVLHTAPPETSPHPETQEE